MRFGSDSSKRKVRKIGLAVAGVEERVLLSSGIAGPLRAQVAHFAVPARAQRLALAGSVRGTLTPQQLDAQTLSLSGSLQGNTGNRKLGAVTITASGTAPITLLQEAGSKKLVLTGLSVTFTTANGTDVSTGTLTLSKSRSMAKIPFTVKVQLSNGTGLLAGATGTYTIQGNFNATNYTAAGQLRGTIVAKPAN